MSLEVVTVRSSIRLSWRWRLRYAWHRFRLGRRGRELEDAYVVWLDQRILGRR